MPVSSATPSLSPVYAKVVEHISPGWNWKSGGVSVWTGKGRPGTPAPVHGSMEDAFQASSTSSHVKYNRTEKKASRNL